jgi:FkbM family methyltransferase
VLEPKLTNLVYIKQRLLGTSFAKDIHYPEELKKVPDEAHVLEVGAMDGVRFDQLHLHIVRRKWRAIVVEPLPDMFQLLRDNYSRYPWVKCVNAAIAEQSGSLSMFRVNPEEATKRGIGQWVVGITSALKGPVLTYLNDIVSEETVKALTFNDFVRKYSVEKIDVLQIDTEGYDWKILQQIDLYKWNIGLIQIEIINLMPCDRSRVFSYLGAAGYLLNYDGMDVTAVRRAA